MHVLVAGPGWVGIEIVRALVARGHRVTAVRRSEAGKAEIVAAGARPLLLDLSAPSSVEALPAGVDAIISCVAPSGSGIEDYRRTYLDANRNLIAYVDTNPLQAFIYTGSTGVFERNDGGDVEESTPPSPESDTGRVLATAEQFVLAAGANKVRACVVRLSGLYGPGRAGVIDRVRTGRLTLGPGDDAWMNFCHRDDAVALVLAVLDAGTRSGIYHGSDAFPTRRRDVVSWIAEHLGIEPPRATATTEARAPNRRVLGVATRRELGVGLRYPSFRDGLEPLLLDAMDL